MRRLYLPRRAALRPRAPRDRCSFLVAPAARFPQLPAKTGRPVGRASAAQIVATDALALFGS
jgi:hypothetical protein